MMSVGVSKLGYTLWYSSFLESKSWSLLLWVMCCCHNSCCLPYARSLISSSSFSKPVPHRTGAVDDQPPWTQDSCIHLDRFLITQQPRPQSSWIYSLGHNAAVSLQDKNAGCGQFEAVYDWWLDWNATKRYRRCHKPVVYRRLHKYHNWMWARGGHLEYSLWLTKQ